MQSYLIKTWLFPLILILAFGLFGIVFEKIFFNKLNEFITKREFPGSQLLLVSLQRIPSLVFLLMGIYGAIFMMPIDPKLSAILQKFLVAISLFTIFLVLAKLTAGFVRLSSQRIEGLSVSLLSNLAQIFVLTLGLLITLQTLGIEITPIIATLGVGGLAVALAFQDTFSNLLSGLYLIISRQVKRGDYIKLASGEEGYVHDITWRNTTIREIPNNIIIVPNNKLSNAIFKNYHLPFKEIILQIPVGVSYDSNLEKVEKVTVEVAQTILETVEGGISEFQPFIRYQA
ncbi:MAG: mechanosensitive ion channel domain-containing protein, partial [Coleofasciculaceae cyanobacterium]